MENLYPVKPVADLLDALRTVCITEVTLSASTADIAIAAGDADPVVTLKGVMLENSFDIDGTVDLSDTDNYLATPTLGITAGYKKGLFFLLDTSETTGAITVAISDEVALTGEIIVPSWDQDTYVCLAAAVIGADTAMTIGTTALTDGTNCEFIPTYNIIPGERKAWDIG